MTYSELPEDQRTAHELSPFGNLGITADSVGRFEAERSLHDRAKWVCICGHALNKHKEFESNRWSCLTARHWCPCQFPKAVVSVSDTRYFMRKTYGPGSKHALSTGLGRLIQVRKSFDWLETPSCWNPNCERTNVKIFPVAISKYKKPSNQPGPINVLFCESCYLREMGLAGREGMGYIW